MKKIISLITVLSLTAVLASCSASGDGAAPGAEKYSKTSVAVFDTVTTLIGYDESEESFGVKADVIFTELERLHRLFDIYHAYEGISNLKTVNDNAGKAPVTVDADIIEMLTVAKEMYEKTDGKTNIAMGSVLGLWHDWRENENRGAPPEESALRAAAEHIDISCLEIDADAGTVFITDSAASLDVGAVAKGYAADRACEAAAEHGWTSLALSVGGNVKTIGTRGDGSEWNIGINDPDEKSETGYFALVRLTDRSLVTSGSYQRYVDYNGVRYHHIIDSATLYPAEGFVSVSVLSESSAAADALSTALFCMSYEDGAALAKREGVDVVWLYADGSYIATDGADAAMKK